MQIPDSVFVLVLSGSTEEAEHAARNRYPGCRLITLSKRELREAGWKQQLQKVRRLKGKALLVFTESIEDVNEPVLLKATIILHRCEHTVIADSAGHSQVFNRNDAWKVLVQAALAVAADLCIILLSWPALQILRFRLRARDTFARADGLSVAYLYPFPMDRALSGGALTHVTGFLSGLAESSAQCSIFAGRCLPVSSFPLQKITHGRRFFLFRESVSLSYNLRFARKVEQALANHLPTFLYQRHGAYVVSGALLAHRLRRPLVLEYNGSEVWISQHWDPAKLLPWLRACEEISLSAATLVTVVSDALKQELIERGVPSDKIVVNPNAVDPNIFRPDCGGRETRGLLGFRPEHVVVGFIGSFSYWHGIAVLQQAIERLLKGQESGVSDTQLRFLLVGDGPLRPDIRAGLEPYTARGWVVFTGLVPHEKAASYLDAADILVSPHVPMSDGSHFFGSPTKLFEYMAMGKAIVASKLDQLAHVLTHQQTAWLTKPGSSAELADAILMLASNREMRLYLGRHAREAALKKHTWQQNAANVLSCFSENVGPMVGSPQPECSGVVHDNCL